MDHSPHGMMQFWQVHMIVMWAGIAAVGAGLIFLIYVFTRPASPRGTSLADLSGARGLVLPDTIDQDGNVNIATAPPVDTIFILPDISNYTRFMTGTQFSFAHAQHIIFSLINAMIGAATNQVQLSKLEGDAALFFADADSVTEVDAGKTVMEIFSAFFRERRRLKNSNICPCHACRHIDTLDLKIFVHRGKAARFRFRGSVDLFGTDVIVLHRIMKNNVTGHRYVMVTDAAASSVALPELTGHSVVEQDVDHVGRLRASVFEIDDVLAEQLARLEDQTSTSNSSVVRDALAKFAENFRTIWSWRRRAGREC